MLLGASFSPLFFCASLSASQEGGSGKGREEMLIVEQMPLNCNGNREVVGGGGAVRAGIVEEAGLKEKFSLDF